jgi:hypothetical protein
MERFDIFNGVHKALRAMLYDAALSLQQTDFSRIHEKEAVMQKILKVIQLFDTHAQQEDDYVLNAIAVYEPTVVDVFKLEHVQDLKNYIAINKAANEMKHVATKAEAVVKGKALSKAFVTFMTYNLNRMNKEEEVLNHLLWRYYSDEELKALENEIINAVTVDKESFLQKWMMRGMNNTEITAWLKEAEQEPTGQQFQNLFAIAENELSKKRFLQLVEALTEGVMMA